MLSTALPHFSSFPGMIRIASFVSNPSCLPISLFYGLNCLREEYEQASCYDLHMRIFPELQ